MPQFRVFGKNKKTGFSIEIQMDADTPKAILVRMEGSEIIVERMEEITSAIRGPQPTGFGGAPNSSGISAAATGNWFDDPTHRHGTSTNLSGSPQASTIVSIGTLQTSVQPYVPPAALPIFSNAANITLHTGASIPADMEYFGVPPADLGSVCSLYSSLLKGQQPMDVPIRIAIISGILGLFMFVAFIFPPFLYWGIGIGIVGGLVAFFCTKFSHRTTYVCEFGVVSFQMTANRTQIQMVNYLNFNNAASVFSSQTRNFVNGVYNDTDYSYIWCNAAGKTILSLSGAYHAKDGLPRAEDGFHFARMAEIAWSSFRLDALQDELNRNGYIAFALDHKKVIRVGRGFIEFHFEASPVRIDVADIGKYELKGGCFTIHHKDVRWWSGKGKFSFGYASMPNARLFLLVLDCLCGIRA